MARQANSPVVIERMYGKLSVGGQVFRQPEDPEFTLTAIAEYDRLRTLKLNVGKNDLRIAAIALVNNAIVVTRNLRDFKRIPGLTVEDWSQPQPASPAPPAPLPELRGGIGLPLLSICL